jgi:integrase
MTVKLRQRKKGNKISLYLDYYQNGKRTYEYLKLYLYVKPEDGNLTREQARQNKDILALAESIEAKRKLEIKNNDYGFADQSKLKADFLEYMKGLAEKRMDSSGNYGNWSACIKHLTAYKPRGISFDRVDKDFVQGFKDYLDYDAKTKSKKGLSQNSKYSYYNKFCAALKQAVKDGILRSNPAEQVNRFKQAESQREFLTFEELKALATTPAEDERLKKAFIFSCLTGLRWGDATSLTWGQIQYTKETGHFIRFRQEKTEGAETLPIADDAMAIIGEPGEPTHKVFRGLKYHHWDRHSTYRWITAAGITKHITYHCSRHTFATLQLTLGTDMYTVSKMLGHKNITTTQIYAKIIDKKKVDAVNRINLGL